MILQAAVLQIDTAAAIPSDKKYEYTNTQYNTPKITYMHA